MRAIRKHPGEPIEVIDVKNDLGALQDEVGGYIETVTLWEDAVVICNEDGRLSGEPYNCTLCGVSFVGTILIVGVYGDEFTDCPATLEEIEQVME